MSRGSGHFGFRVHTRTRRIVRARNTALTQATVEGLQDQVEPQVNRSSMTAQAGFTGVYWSRVHSCWMQRLHFKGLCCEGNECGELSVFLLRSGKVHVEAILSGSSCACDLDFECAMGPSCAFCWQPRPPRQVG